MHGRVEIPYHPAFWPLALLTVAISAPFQYFFLGLFVLILLTVVISKPSIQQLITAVNSISNNPMAIIVIIIGCVMHHQSQASGESTDIASTIVGYGGSLLQAQIKDQLHPPGSIVNSTQETKVVTPPDPPAIAPPK